MKSLEKGGVLGWDRSRGLTVSLVAGILLRSC
jgi:hypothetical protein